MSSSLSSPLSRSAVGTSDGALTILQRPTPAETAAVQATIDAANAAGTELPENPDHWHVVRVLQLATGPGSAIVALAWDPLERFLAVSTAAGTVLVVAATGEEAYAAPVATLPAPKKSAPMSVLDLPGTEHPLAWHPRGEALAYASETGVAVVVTGAWTAPPVYDLSLLHRATATPAAAAASPVASACNALVWSPNGRYLAAADCSRHLAIFDVTTADPAVEGPAGSPSRPCRALFGVLPEQLDEDGAEASAAAMPFSSSQADDGTGDVAFSRVRGSVSGAPVTSMVWPEDGRSVVFVDSNGSIGAARVHAILTRNGGGSPKEPVASFVWPLTVAAEAAEAPVGTSATAAAALAAATATTAAAAAPAPSKRAAYVDGEAMEADDDAEEEASEAGVGAAADSGATQAAAAASLLVTEALAAAKALGKATSAAALLTTSSAAAAAAEDDGPAEVSLSAEKRAHGFVDADGSGDEGGGLRSIYHPPAPSAAAGMGGPRFNMNEMVSRVTSRIMRDIEDRLGLVPMQSPFQSGSTPFPPRKGARAVSKRYIVWNAAGAITSRKEGPSTKVSIEFEDADAAGRASIHLDDQYGYSLGALTEQGAVLASAYSAPASDRAVASEDGQPACITFKGFGEQNSSWWRMSFPVRDARRPRSSFPARAGAGASKAGSGSGVGGGASDEEDEEEAGGALGGTGGGSSSDDADTALDTSEAAESPLAVALGDGWMAAATDWRRLYFIRTGKNQDGAITVPGPVVTLAARGALCAVAYHRTSPSGGSQHIAVDLYLYRTLPAPHLSAPGVSTSLPQLVRTVDLPLRPNAHLAWFDFSSTGMLLAMDSEGLLLGLQPGYNWAWATVCDTRAGLGKHEIAWPVSVSLSTVEGLRRDPTDTSSDASVQCFNLKGLVPALSAVILKAATAHPPVVTPRPVKMVLPLRMPLLDTGDLSAFDDSYVRAELVRVQRAWCSTVGLSYEDGATSVPLHAALEAASALARGEDALDAALELEASARATALAEHADSSALDKALLRRIQQKTDEPTSAVQLACRLHLDKSFEVASMIANRANRAALGERMVQLMLARKQQSAASSAAAASAAPAHHVAAPAPAAPAPAAAAAPAIVTPAATRDRLADPMVLSSSSSSANAANAGSAGSGSSAVNPFRKKEFSSPSRNKRKDRGDGLDALTAGDSPMKPTGGAGARPALARQSSFAAEARLKRLRENE
jgi:trimeric autotransporter adhesin